MYLFGNKPGIYCAIDPYTKHTVPRIATTAPGLNSKMATEEVVRRYGPAVVIINDNGNENKGKAGEFPAEKEIIQYRAPLRPREKPHIERFIGTFQRECPDYHYEPVNAAELKALVDDWPGKYNSYRPHKALGGLTPAEFSATLNLPVPHKGVYYR